MMLPVEVPTGDNLMSIFSFGNAIAMATLTEKKGE